MKGQVTLFAVMGVMLLVVVGFLLYASDGMKSVDAGLKEKSVSFDYNEGTIKSFVASCIEPLARSAVNEVALGGGYMNYTARAKYFDSDPAAYVFLSGIQIPVWLNATGEMNVPENDIEKRLCRKVYLDLADCLNFSVFLDQDINVSVNDLKSDPGDVDAECKAIIRSESVVLNIKYLTSAKSKGSNLNVAEFTSTSHLHLGNTLDEAGYLVSKIKASSGKYNFSKYCAEYVSAGYDNKITFDPDKGILQILDRSDNYSLVFQIAIKDYDLSGGCP